MKRQITERWIPTGYTESIENPQFPGSVIYHDPKKTKAIAYKGKAKKAKWHFAFKTTTAFERRVEEFFSILEREKKEKENKKVVSTAPGSTLKIGDILVSQWGYEQTNVDFFQIVRRTSKTIWIRGIKQQNVTSDTFGETGKVIPLKNQFIEEEHKHRIFISGNVESGCSLNSFSTAFKWEGKPVIWTAYN